MHHSLSKAFLQSCLVLNDGFVAWDAASIWRVGTILFASNGDSFAIVQKAAAQSGAYEFEGKWALPGGMVRAGDRPQGEPADPAALARESVRHRAAKECGLTPENMQALCFAHGLGPVVTSYTAKGEKRYTLVIAQTCDCAIGTSLSVADRSVQAALWSEIPPVWETFAPANRLIVAHLLWSRLDAPARAAATPAVAAAAELCSEWAAEIGLGSVPRPWDDADILMIWRSAFPG